MKVSEVQVNDVIRYIKEDSENLTPQEIQDIGNYLTVAKNFIEKYTGIPSVSSVEGEKTIDDYEDFYIVVMVLCQDMYDNRSMYVEKSNLNKVVDTILGMHCKNLL